MDVKLTVRATAVPGIEVDQPTPVAIELTAAAVRAVSSRVIC